MNFEKIQLPFHFQECRVAPRFSFFIYHWQKHYIIPTAFCPYGTTVGWQPAAGSGGWCCPAAGALAVSSACTGTHRADVCGTLRIWRWTITDLSHCSSPCLQNVGWKLPLCFEWDSSAWRAPLVPRMKRLIHKRMQPECTRSIRDPGSQVLRALLCLKAAADLGAGKERLHGLVTSHVWHSKNGVWDLKPNGKQWHHTESKLIPTTVK